MAPGTALTAPSKAWAQAIAQPASEFAATYLTVLSGAIPTELQGRLYRNGPARFERQGQRVSHWFDGDGAVLLVRFAEGKAQGTYRYVRSAGYVEEENQGQLLYSGYGTRAPGPFWQRWQAQLKNAANTSVLALSDRLLALWEGGLPHRLDLDTLATEGVDTLGQLATHETFSAHPKRHPATRQVFNFGVLLGAQPRLNLYRCAPDGTIQQKSDIPLNGIPLLHDCVLADQYLVFCVPPVRLNPLPAALGLQSFSEALMWQPKLGTQVVVVDADTLEVISSETAAPWFQWHFGKGFVNRDGDIVLEVVRYVDFATNQQLQEVASGQMVTAAPAQLWRVCIAPQTAQVRSQTCLVEHHCEFPVVPLVSGDEAIAAAPTYLTLHAPTQDATGELFRAIAGFHPDTAHLDIAIAGDDCYPSEPIFVGHPSGRGGWVLTVVYNGGENQSEVWIYDSDRLADGALCRLQLPGIVPPSFHGTWHPDA